MELRQLTYFDAVVRHGGFTRAAEALHVAQPAISAQVRRLESELGVALLARTTRRVELTQAGELFLRRVRRVHDEIGSARAELEQLSGALRGRVRIGVVEALGPYDIAGALSAFHRRYPGIELALSSLPTGRELLAELDDSHLDLVLAPLPEDSARYSAHSLISEELVVITSPDHPLGSHARLTMGELEKEDFVSFPDGTGLRRILDDAASRAGYRPRVPFETTDLTRVRELVSHGLGVALVPHSIAASDGPRITRHSLRPDAIHRDIFLIRRADREPTPAAQACHSVLARWPESGEPARAVGPTPVRDV